VASSRIGAGSVAALDRNLFWDGVLHLSLMALLAAGLALAAPWRRVDPAAGRRFGSLLLVGWGTFNVLDQLVFHLALGLHHIRPGPHQTLYDWTFFVLGLALALLGVLLAPPRSSS
jgi:uncharacterized membrane protein